MESKATLEAIRYKRGELVVLNQLLLPNITEYETMNTIQDTFDAIKQMKVRGAPAIAISAALSVAVDAFHLLENAPASVSETVDLLSQKLDHLEQSRPTAVNLHNAVEELKAVIKSKAQETSDSKAVLMAYLEAAEKMLEKDVQDNLRISEYGGKYILNMKHTKDKKQVQVLTHCNTGALATAKYGTALGVVRYLHANNALKRVFASETRPYNQGARLTAYECATEGIPCTLLVDSCISLLLSNMLNKSESSGVDAVVVGADRVCANGDTANKIGTYHHAVSAKFHGIPFFVAAPSSSIDLNLTSGDQIVIEERSGREITHHPITGDRMVAEGVDVWNPGFDVTPAQLITGGIITEFGVIEPDAEGKLHVKEFIQKHLEKSN